MMFSTIFKRGGRNVSQSRKPALHLQIYSCCRHLEYTQLLHKRPSRLSNLDFELCYQGGNSVRKSLDFRLLSTGFMPAPWRVHAWISHPVTLTMLTPFWFVDPQPTQNNAYSNTHSEKAHRVPTFRPNCTLLNRDRRGTHSPHYSHKAHRIQLSWAFRQPLPADWAKSLYGALLWVLEPSRGLSAPMRPTPSNLSLSQIPKINIKLSGELTIQDAPSVPQIRSLIAWNAHPVCVYPCGTIVYPIASCGAQNPYPV